MIAELNFEEMLCIAGGTEPTCPEGTKLSTFSRTESSDGSWTQSYTCTATSTTQTVAEGASIFSDIADGARDLLEAGKDLIGL